MKKNYFFNVLLSLFAISMQAQNYVHQLIIVNEGRYDFVNSTQVIPVTVASYDPSSKVYSVFDTIQNARFASDVLVDGSNIYVAADSFLISYNKDSYQKVNSVIVPGIRKIDEWNNQILVSRGDVVNLNSYFQAYDKNTFNKLYELDTITGPKYASEGIAVINDTAYLAVNNGFSWGNYKGKLGIVDLANQSYNSEVDLGPDGLNPDNLMSDNGKIYTLNNKDWSGSSVSTFDPLTRTSQTTNLSVSTGCGTSVKASDYIYFQESGSSEVARFNVNSQLTTDTLPLSKSFYGMITDSINSLIYATSTDYVSFGKAYIMNYSGALLDSFNISVSPGNMALDIRNLLSVKSHEMTINKIYPNPASNKLTVSTGKIQDIKKIQITDISGKVVFDQESSITNNQFQIDISHLMQGIYFLKIAGPDGVSNSKFIKN